MNRFKTEVTEVLAFIIRWGFAYLILIEGVKGALNVMEFLVAFSFIVALVRFTEKSQEQMMTMINDRSWLRDPVPFYQTTSIVLAIAYIWFDHMILGSFLFIGLILTELAWSMARDKKKAKDEEKAAEATQ